MDSTQREEFDSQMETLFGAWGRNYAAGLQSGYWKGLQSMALSELARTVEAAIGKFRDDPDMRLPTVGELWRIRRNLRAPAASVAPVDQWQGDQWDIQANHHFMAVLMRRVLSHAGGFDEAQTLRLVAAKKLWAQDMRETAVTGCVDTETQAGAWAYRVGALLKELEAA